MRSRRCSWIGPSPSASCRRRRRVSRRRASSCADAADAGAGALGPTPTEADWDAEYLDLVLAIRVVDGLDAAIEHIRAHGTGLAEAIVTGHLGRARRFTREVDAAGVLVNASPRLLDGNQFGMARRWASPPRACTREARWACAS